MALTNHLLFVYFKKLIIQESCHGCKSVYGNIFIVFTFFIFAVNCIDIVRSSVLKSTVVDRGLEPRSDQIKDYEIGICGFYTKHSVKDIRQLWLYCLGPSSFLPADCDYIV